MLLIDNFFDRLAARLRRSRHLQLNEPFPDPEQTPNRPQRSNSNRRGHGILEGANNFVIKQSTLVDHQVVQMFAAGKPVLDPVLELIAPHTDPNAAVDSSARFPPPLCHPGTRLKIGDSLFSWLTDPERKWNMIWLNGPAGTGKSAVAQTFAERCVENRHLGAAFFFSRPNNRNDPNTVIPSLVYQLAVRLPAYKSLVTAQLANDPQLVWKARHIQFNQLIVGPFLQLQSQQYTRIQKPLLIVLDGLDECKGEDAQRDIIEMISEAARLNKSLPLLWLICSRPEAHLKHIFSQVDYILKCGREELAIDAESIADVDLYIQDGLAGIKIHFPDATSPTWPQEEQVTELRQKASGHFGFASTALRYIGDVTCATPMAQLDDLLSFLKGVQTGTSNPLEGLDALYAGILDDIPDKVLQITKRILGYYMIISTWNSYGFQAVQFVCNFFHIDQATFYSASRKLHSVIDVPTPETAFEARLRFYHASFEDYLRHRSGGFVNLHKARLDYAKMCFSWVKTDLELFHINDSPLESIRLHEHEVLPDLKWASDTNRAQISFRIIDEAWDSCWWNISVVESDEDLSQMHNFDFRYTRSYPCRSTSSDWYYFVNDLWRTDPTCSIVRTEPRSEEEFCLLEYMRAMTKSGVRLEPATFPLDGKGFHSASYFLVGHGSKAIACWAADYENYGFEMMACGMATSKEGNKVYNAWLIGGDD